VSVLTVDMLCLCWLWICCLYWLWIDFVSICGGNVVSVLVVDLLCLCWLCIAFVSVGSVLVLSVFTA
jgi:hypothetical protein